MISDKRIIILCGHYGSGKTNIAVNLAFALKKNYQTVALADLDIVNPYYRSKDAAAMLSNAEIRLISSAFANTSLDIPALPQEIYAITDDKNFRFVLDVGGDDRGALALGRIVKEIKNENNYEMLLIVNMYRPLTRTASDTIAIMREIENACKLNFTAIVNNSNLGAETTPQTVLNSMQYAEEISALTGLPIAFTSVCGDLFDELEEEISDVFCLTI